jgi:hypothetical protein
VFGAGTTAALGPGFSDGVRLGFGCAGGFAFGGDGGFGFPCGAGFGLPAVPPGAAVGVPGGFAEKACASNGPLAAAVRRTVRQSEGRSAFICRMVPLELVHRACHGSEMRAEAQHEALAKRRGNDALAFCTP